MHWKFSLGSHMLDLEFWDVEPFSIPYMGKAILTSVFLLKFWVFHSIYCQWRVLALGENFPMCCNFVLNSFRVNKTALVYCVKVLMIIHLASMWWWLSQWKLSTNKPKNIMNKNNSTHKGYKVIPYVKGLYESIKGICSKYGIKDIPVSPKAKDPIQHKSYIIYWYRCDIVDSNEEYIGESAITFGERYKEPSPYIPKETPLTIKQPLKGSWLCLDNQRIHKH